MSVEIEEGFITEASAKATACVLTEEITRNAAFMPSEIGR